MNVRDGTPDADRHETAGQRNWLIAAENFNQCCYFKVEHRTVSPGVDNFDHCVASVSQLSREALRV